MSVAVLLVDPFLHTPLHTPLILLSPLCVLRGSLRAQPCVACWLLLRVLSAVMV